MSATRTKSTYDVNGLKFRKASFEEETMTAKHLFVLGASILAATLAGGAVAQQADERYVQMAEIEVDPVQLDAYRAAVQEQIDAAIRKEPGVLVLYAVSEKDNPTNVKVFEIYRNRAAYEAHLASDHFKKYKATVEKMVRSLKLIQTTPIMLGAQTK
jgi:quinol monooxygenase YgiN